MEVLTIDRRAYLHWIRNIRSGLSTRSAILKELESNKRLSASRISAKVHVTASTVSYHLRNMEREDIVVRDPEGNGWRLGNLDQTVLTDYASKRKKKSRKKPNKKT
ncbi:MAG: winged helix-turn-helix domain-containing protein [Candidatus Thorarchaeota archaeon]